MSVRQNELMQEQKKIEKWSRIVVPEKDLHKFRKLIDEKS